MKPAKRERITWLSIGLLAGIFISGLFLLIFQEPSLSSSALLINRSSESTVASLVQQTIVCPSENIISGGNRIDINTASETELNELPGIGEAKANSIIEFRQRYGAFKSIDELLYVPGISESLYADICASISVGSN